MKYTGEISINEVLAEIQTPGQEFSLYFVRSTGKEKGVAKYLPKCMYGAKRKDRPPGQRIPNRSPEEKTIRKQGTVPIHNVETGLYLTPLISHIIGYNNKKVIH